MQNFELNNTKIDLPSTNLCQNQDPNVSEERWEFSLPISTDVEFNMTIEPIENAVFLSELICDDSVEELPPLWFNLEESGWKIDEVSIENDLANNEIKPKNKTNKERLEPKIGETKNIPKNFGKQIIKFVKENEKFIVQILRKMKSKVKYSEINNEMQKKKNRMNKINDLKDMWLSKAKLGKEMRIISTYFLRRHGYSWIFNSRISDFQSHLKYRTILSRMIRNPEGVSVLKSDF